MENTKEKTSELIIGKLRPLEEKFNDYELPKVSIIIPSLNCASSITLTLESILIQDYPDFEIIIVDGGSQDRTLEVINSFRKDQIQIFSVSDYQRYEMLNKGISQASGLYINFLFPGDFYISRETLRHLMCYALEHGQPELVYCGTLLRDGRSDVKTLLRQLTLKLLKGGQQPTSLQSCWFKRNIFSQLGKFNPSYHLRGGFEFLCRFSLKKNFKSVFTNRILTDYDLRWVTSRMVFTHFWETMRTIYHYFGFLTTIQWLFYQKDGQRFRKLWFRKLKVAFFGR